MKDSTKKSTIAPSSTAPVASSSAKARVAAPEKGTLMKKKNTAAADPTLEAKPSRTFVKATSGARYGVRVMFQRSVAPEAGATQANGRILPSAIRAQSLSFRAGMGDHN